MRIGDITGRSFGMLEAVAPGGISWTGFNSWFFLCECGSVCEAEAAAVLSGKTRSCGCSSNSWRTGRPPVHGEHGSPEYRAWQGMLSRVSPTAKSRHYYFERGISVCERWGSFENFLADMGRKPSPRHSLDRIDNAGNYGPGNCRWATPAQQNSNRRPESEWRRPPGRPRKCPS